MTQKKSGLMSKKVPLCFVDVDVDDLIASQGESGAADQASASSSSSSPPAPPAQWYDMDLASGAKVKGAGPARMKLKASIVQKSSASASDFRGDVPDVDDDDKEDIDFVIDKFNSVSQHTVCVRLCVKVWFVEGMVGRGVLSLYITSLDECVACCDRAHALLTTEHGQEEETKDDEGHSSKHD